MTANLFDSEPAFGREGMSAPGRRAARGVFVMTEPPYTGAPCDEARGRVLRLFWRYDGLPIPPDEPAE